jgi:hypothetical protein
MLTVMALVITAAAWTIVADETLDAKIHPIKSNSWWRVSSKSNAMDADFTASDKLWGFEGSRYALEPIGDDGL